MVKYNDVVIWSHDKYNFHLRVCEVSPLCTEKQNKTKTKTKQQQQQQKYMKL